MLKKFWAVGSMLIAGLLFVHPTPVDAQARYDDRGSYGYYNDRGYERNWRNDTRQSFREERKDRKWREKELREREKWERRNYRDNYYRGYGSNGGRGYDYRDPYRPY